MMQRFKPFQAGHTRCIGEGRPQRTATIAHAKLTFSVKHNVGFGGKVVIVGNADSLGSWNVDGGAKLKWTDNDVWKGSVDVPDGQEVEFKLVGVRDGSQDWEQCDNRKHRVEGARTTLELEWANPSNSHVKTEKGGNGASPPAHEEKSNGAQAGKSDGNSADERLAHNSWQGQEISFMRDNKHSKERRGVWDASGLEGVPRALVQGDEKAGSWLQKLEVAKRLIVDDSEGMRPGLDTLAPLYIYLHWISTGSIRCVEGGGHFRPNRHAELSKIMFRSIEWVAGDPRKSPLERLVARKMISKLPSFSEAFTASVPLTRIRDIAHRNDIPSDVKSEIKHTLQNKLHRNAGPEDLVATELMLQRITRNPGEFNDSFVSEFKIFTDELRDFFSAGSLTKMLDAVLPAMPEMDRIDAQRFLDAKAKLDQAGTGADMNLVMDVMHKLTTARAGLLSMLSSGLRNDAPDSALVMRQRVRLAELRCEEYCYVVLSRFINLLDGMGGVGYLANAREEAWAQPLGAMSLAVRHCCLSGWKPHESAAIGRELEKWQQLGVAQDKTQTLRLKASLERSKRLTDDYAQAMLDTFADKAVSIGKALGVPNEVQTVFTEAEIRANIAFQLAKLSTTLLQAARTMLGSGDFDLLVTGTAVGELVQVDRIEAGQEHAGGRPCVLLVKSADGDEEVTAAGKNIRGIILCQDLPHLSHLGVRARQERCTFVTCTSDDVINNVVRPLLGKTVELVADGTHVTVKQSTAGADSKSAGPEGSAKQGAPSAAPMTVKKVTSVKVLPLSSAESETCGAKAAACAKLAQAARNTTKGAEFSAAAGAALPFGCMDAAIKAAGREKEYAALLDEVEGCAFDALAGVCDKMQQLIMQCPPDDAALKALQKEIPGAAIVIARSSANVEDLAGMSGAGLYESIPNLELASLESLRGGITRVWASLFARRAVLSRRTAGVAQKDACMAVLVQEMMTPDMCFVLHTRNPMQDSEPDRGASSLYAEVAPGMGETLASGSSGSAWRLSVDKATQAVNTLAFANFSEAWMPANAKRARAPGASIYSLSSADGGSSVDAGDAAQLAGKVATLTVDYSEQALSVDSAKREALAKQLCRIGVMLEESLGAPQDVEGALVGDTVYVVQTRPQP